MTARMQDRYGLLAALFDYPDRDYPTRVRTARAAIGDDYPDGAAALDAFERALPSKGETCTTEELYELQEIFTRSFDVQSITTLGVGYVMFGDDYKRAEVLVNLNREQEDAGVDCGCELADHLPNVLRLIGKWQNRDLVVEFVESILHPALEMMIAEFGSRRMEERNGLYKKHFKTLIATSPERGTIFCQALTAVVEVLKQDFALSSWEAPEHDNDFLRSIGRELDIEANEGRPAPSGRML